MKPIRILAIGNSFSQDAFGLLHAVAEERGLDVETVNLYIGGCSLERHHQNLLSGEAAYDYEKNAVKLRNCSIDEALAEGDWDYISLQQVSHESGIPETYEPFLEVLVAHIRKTCPNTKLLMHETWAYEQDSTHSGFAKYNNDQTEMYVRARDTYRAAAERYGLHLIPSGEAVQALRAVDPFRYEAGGMSLCRDGFHMHLYYGRYLLALTWLAELFGVRATDSGFVPNDGCDPAALTVLRKTVDAFFQKRLQK